MMARAVESATYDDIRRLRFTAATAWRSRATSCINKRRLDVLEFCPLCMNIREEHRKLKAGADVA